MSIQFTKMFVLVSAVSVLFLSQPILADEEVQRVEQIQQEDIDAKKVVENCALQTSANLTAILHPDYAGDDPNFSCFFRCTFMTLGFIDQNGNTNLTKYAESFSLKEGAKEGVKACANSTEENICDRALETQICVFNSIDFDDYVVN